MSQWIQSSSFWSIIWQMASFLHSVFLQENFSSSSIQLVRLFNTPSLLLESLFQPILCAKKTIHNSWCVTDFLTSSQWPFHSNYFKQCFRISPFHAFAYILYFFLTLPNDSLLSLFLIKIASIASSRASPLELDRHLFGTAACVAENKNTDMRRNKVYVDLIRMQFKQVKYFKDHRGTSLSVSSIWINQNFKHCISRKWTYFPNHFPAPL